MRYVITPCGKYGTVTAEKNEQCEVKFYNGKTNWYAKHKLTDLAKEQQSKPPSRAHDHLLLTIKTIEGMHKTASESNTDFAQGAEMAYSLVLDMLNKLK